MSSVFFTCETCQQIISARNANERIRKMLEKRKTEFLDALKRKRDRDLLTLQQQMRANKANLEKMSNYISIKDSLHNDIVEFLKPDKVKLLPAHIQTKTRDAAKQLHDESSKLTQVKQRLIAETSNIERKVQFVNSQHQADTTVLERIC